MKEVELKRVGIKSILKSSIAVLGGLGLVLDIIFKIITLLSMPTAGKASDGVTSTYVYAISQNVGNSFASFVLSIFHFTIYGIVIAIIITLIAILFNFISNKIGGIEVSMK